MNEKEEDVVHAGILSNSQKLPEFRRILEFATDTPSPESLDAPTENWAIEREVGEKRYPRMCIIGSERVGDSDMGRERRFREVTAGKPIGVCF
jgi:hypothetical protein